MTMLKASLDALRDVVSAFVVSAVDPSNITQ